VYVSEKLAERIAKFSAGVAMIMVGDANKTELEDRKLDDPDESLGANTIQRVMRY
jgi:chaperonin GroEL (HSP60 family)